MLGLRLTTLPDGNPSAYVNYVRFVLPFSFYLPTPGLTFMAKTRDVFDTSGRRPFCVFALSELNARRTYACTDVQITVE